MNRRDHNNGKFLLGLVGGGVAGYGLLSGFCFFVLGHYFGHQWHNGWLLAILCVGMGLSLMGMSAVPDDERSFMEGDIVTHEGHAFKVESVKGEKAGLSSLTTQEWKWAPLDELEKVKDT